MSQKRKESKQASPAETKKGRASVGGEGTPKLTLAEQRARAKAWADAQFKEKPTTSEKSKASKSPLEKRPRSKSSSPAKKQPKIDTPAKSSRSTRRSTKPEESEDEEEEEVKPVVKSVTKGKKSTTKDSKTPTSSKKAPPATSARKAAPTTSSSSSIAVSQFPSEPARVVLTPTVDSNDLLTGSSSSSTGADTSIANLQAQKAGGFPPKALMIPAVMAIGAATYVDLNLGLTLFLLANMAGVFVSLVHTCYK